VVVGGIIGSLFAWMPLLPRELRVEPVEIREGLAKVCIYLARSNMIPSDTRSQNGVGEWIPSRQWIKWKGSEVEVSVEGRAIVVRGPRSMIKPLWRNFLGQWRNLLTQA
jgi:hypothetical protein